MGIYRLILAIFVVISHAGISFNFFGYNPGVVAVISFFLLSGYVMTMLIEKYYKFPFKPIGFYFDRSARLFPQYIFYLLLASICIYCFKIQSPYISQLTFWKWLLNLLLLPMGYYMYWSNTDALIMPQTRSLGLEMTFYLAIPWIIRFFSIRTVTVLIILSMAVFGAAFCGKINFNFYGYRLLPGTLFMFIIGSLFYKRERIYQFYILFIFALTGGLLLIAYQNQYIYKMLFLKETLVGLLIGIPAIGILQFVKFSAIDEFLGNLSYGVFLNHFLILYMIDRFFTIGNCNLRAAMILFISCTLSFISYSLVEIPALRWRRKFREKLK